MSELQQWLEAIIRHTPGSVGVALRRLWIRHRLCALGHFAIFHDGIEFRGGEGVRIGDNFRMLSHSVVYAHEEGRVEIGNRVSMNANVRIDASCGGVVIISDDVLIGPNVVVRASNHAFSATDRPIAEQGHKPGVIRIGRDVWIGANAVILPDVVIGEHSIVGAGAVVTRDVEPWSIVGGAPARPVGHRAMNAGSIEEDGS